MITKINFYWLGGEWCYAAWAGSEFDHSNPVGLESDATEGEVRLFLAKAFPAATINRVEGVQ